MPRLLKKAVILLAGLLLSTSCVSVSSVSAQDNQPVSFPSIETTEPQWLPISDGINYFRGKISSPRLEFWALRIDLLAPNVKIVINNGAANASDGGGALSTRVSSFVRDNNLLAGINAVPFDVSSSREGQPIRNYGIIISEGRQLAPANSRYDALVIYKNKKAAIVNQSAIRSLENIENAIGGFYQILSDGEPAQRTLNSDDGSMRHPRSAAGISEDGRFLYLLVIDGRRTASSGSTERETALLLRALGSWNAVNFDGGGSTALAMRGPDGIVRVVNTPVHGGFPGQERAVAGCLGVRIEE